MFVAVTVTVPAFVSVRVSVCLSLVFGTDGASTVWEREPTFDAECQHVLYPSSKTYTHARTLPLDVGQSYAHAALEFIVQAHATSKPFLLYAPFNHVHAPNFAAVAFCNTSTHGPVGDATQELDHAIGVIANGVESIPRLDENTVWFFTSDNGAPIGNDNRGNGPLRDGKTTTWEGGIREPAFVRWKGTFAPRYTDALAATYDIYATVLGLAGVAAPTDRVLDGKDLQPILQSASGAAVHRCLIHYWSPQMANSKSSGTTSGVAAVRCGQYKAHFYVRNTGAGSNHKKTMLKAGVQSPPAVFDLDADISESNQLDVATNPAAAAALKEINAALDAHLAGVEMVPNQMVGPSGKQGCTISAATECKRATACRCIRLTSFALDLYIFGAPLSPGDKQCCFCDCFASATLAP